MRTRQPPCPLTFADSTRLQTNRRQCCCRALNPGPRPIGRRACCHASIPTAGAYEEAYSQSPSYKPLSQMACPMTQHEPALVSSSLQLQLRFHLPALASPTAAALFEHPELPLYKQHVPHLTIRDAQECSVLPAQGLPGMCSEGTTPVPQA